MLFLSVFFNQKGNHDVSSHLCEGKYEFGVPKYFYVFTRGDQALGSKGSGFVFGGIYLPFLSIIFFI